MKDGSEVLQTGQSEYDNLIRITQTDADPLEVQSFIDAFLLSPQFQRLQVFSNQAIRILDTSTMKYLYISESNYNLTGYTPKEIAVGGLKVAYKIMPLVDTLRLVKAIFKVKTALKKFTEEEKMRARFSFDARFFCKDGTRKKVLQNCHILQLNHSGDPLILLFASTDISDYKSDTRMNYSLSMYDPGNGFTSILKDSFTEDDCPLSQRELEVLNQTASGFSTKEIADKLTLSLETVKTHRRNMLQKVKAKNTVEMVRMAIANNWI
jgi:DNA-binding CsgD family transcriptional regulator